MFIIPFSIASEAALEESVASSILERCLLVARAAEINDPNLSQQLLSLNAPAISLIEEPSITDISSFICFSLRFSLLVFPISFV